MEDSKQFVRNVTQPEKFSEENSVQHDIDYSNFFHIKVTNKHVLRGQMQKEKLCVFLYLLKNLVCLVHEVYLSRSASKIIGPSCYSSSAF